MTSKTQNMSGRKKTFRLYDDKPTGYVVVWVCANNKELLGHWDRNTVTELIDFLRDCHQEAAADKLVFLRMCGKLHKQKINLCLDSYEYPLSTFLFMSRKYYETKFNLKLKN